MTTTTSDVPSNEGLDDAEMRRRASEARGSMGGRMGAAGMPTEKSKNFGATVRRLLAQLAFARLRQQTQPSTREIQHGHFTRQSQDSPRPS